MNFVISIMLFGHVGFHDIQATAGDGAGKSYTVNSEFNLHLTTGNPATIYRARVNGLGAETVEWLDEPQNLLTLDMPGGNEVIYGANGPLMWRNGNLLNMLVNSYEEYIPGDSNLDGFFSSSDFVEAFSWGNYRNSENPDAVVNPNNENGPYGLQNWIEGDWDGDGIFDSGDFVHAFQWSEYQSEVAVVPEPSSLFLLLIGIFVYGLHKRRKN